MTLKYSQFLLLILILICTKAEAQYLNIHIDKVKSEKGNILLSVYNAEKGFPYESTSCIKIFTLKAKVGKITLSTNEVPSGTYAIALFHDADNNGKLSTNVLGMPKEGYAFSNDATSFLGVPSFKSAAFTLRSDTTIYINMKHF